MCKKEVNFDTRHTGQFFQDYYRKYEASRKWEIVTTILKLTACLENLK